MMKVNVRMNLFHFLNKPYEKDVIDKLSVISADSIVFYLRLWYKDGTVSTKDLKKFLLEYESSLHFKTNIRVGNKNYKSNNAGMVNIQLPVGKHTLIFSLNGYEPMEKVKTLGPNEKAVLEVNLKKLPAGVSSNPDLGFLNIFTCFWMLIKGVAMVHHNIDETHRFAHA